MVNGHTHVCSRSSRSPLHTVVCVSTSATSSRSAPHPLQMSEGRARLRHGHRQHAVKDIHPPAVRVGYIPRLNLRKCARGWPTVYAVAGGRDFTRPHPCLLSAVGTSAASSMNAVLTAVCRGQLFTFDRFAGCRLHFRACCAVDRVHRRGHPCSMNGQHLQAVAVAEGHPWGIYGGLVTTWVSASSSRATKKGHPSPYTGKASAGG